MGQESTRSPKFNRFFLSFYRIGVYGTPQISCKFMFWTFAVATAPVAEVQFCREAANAASSHGCARLCECRKEWTRKKKIFNSSKKPPPHLPSISNNAGEVEEKLASLKFTFNVNLQSHGGLLYYFYNLQFGLVFLTMVHFLKWKSRHLYSHIY